MICHRTNIEVGDRDAHLKACPYCLGYEAEMALIHDEVLAPQPDPLQEVRWDMMQERLERRRQMMEPDEEDNGHVGQ